MHNITGSFSIKALGAAFGVSRAGYTGGGIARHPSQRRLAREKLDGLVAQAFAAGSDRGSQYCPGLCQNLISDEHGLVCCLGGKGTTAATTPAPRASYMRSRWKMVHGEGLLTRKAMRRAGFEGIAIDDNRTRRHIANGRRSPWAFESQKVAWRSVRCAWVRSN